MNEVWWGDFDFANNQTRVWSLGPLTAWITRNPSEFRVAMRHSPDEDEQSLRVGEISDEPIADDAETIRYGVRDVTRRIEIKPATGDRAMIVKSATTYIVPAGGATTVFVSSPLWLQVQLLDPRRMLHEVPTRRPSDTWFGPSTLLGELCYAIRTSVRYNLENVPRRPDRAISVVKVLNHADTPLPLARLRLPLPYLSLFADKGGACGPKS